MVDRKADTLLPIILEYVTEGATIYSDEWSSYAKLADIGYKHESVNHTEGFKSAEGVCTNTVEGVWGLLKQRIIARHGIRVTDMQAYLDEFSYRHQHEGNIFYRLIPHLHTQ